MENELEALLAEHFPQFEYPLRQLIAQKSQLKKFAPGDILMKTGQSIRATMLVIQGRIKLYREGDEGNEFFMYFLEPGEACAMSIMCAAQYEPSPMMAVADENTEAILIPIALIDEMMMKHRSWYQFVIASYRQRFSELIHVLDNIAFKSMDERLVFYLRRQTESLNSRLLKITHQQIANDLNSSREVISRLLKKMEQQGLVTLHRNAIEVAK
jgi:CRP/FNR family transcriptional regulator